MDIHAACTQIIIQIILTNRQWRANTRLVFLMDRMFKSMGRTCGKIRASSGMVNEATVTLELPSQVLTSFSHSVAALLKISIEKYYIVGLR